MREFCDRTVNLLSRWNVWNTVGRGAWHSDAFCEIRYEEERDPIPVMDRDIEPLRIYLLGSFRVVVAGREIPAGAWKRRAAADLIKFLALEPGHAAHPETLTDALWADFDPFAAANKLHKAIHAARHALEPRLPHRASSTYLHLAGGMLALHDVWVDVDRFEEVARVALRHGDRDAIMDALALYTGPLLPSDRYADWTTTRRQEGEALYRRLILTLARLLGKQEAYAEAIDHLHPLLRLDRTDEEVHRRIMELYVSAGQPDEALRQYAILSDVLDRDLGTTPDRQTEALRATIARSMTTLEDVSRIQDTPSSDHAAMQVQLGQVLVASGKYQEALSHLGQALTAYAALGDPDGRARALAAIGRVHFAAGTAAEGVALLETGNELTLSPSARAVLLASLAGLYWLQSAYRRQLQAAGMAEELADAGGLREVQAEAGVWRGVALVAMGQEEEGLAVLEQGATRAEAVGDAALASRALNTIAAILQERGDYVRAHTYLEPAIVLAGRSGDPVRLTFMLYRSGWNAWNLGRWNEARRTMEWATAVSESFPSIWPRVYALHGLAWLHLCRGEYDQAREWAQRAAHDIEQGGDRRAQWALHGLLATLEHREGRLDRAQALFRAALNGAGLTDADRSLLLSALAQTGLRQGNVVLAMTCLREALRLAEASGAKPAIFEALIGQALHARLEGDHLQAERLLRRARQTAADMKQPFHQARVWRAQAEVERALGRERDAARHQAQAHDVFDALGIRPQARDEP